LTVSGLSYSLGAAAKEKAEGQLRDYMDRQAKVAADRAKIRSEKMKAVWAKKKAAQASR